MVQEVSIPLEWANNIPGVSGVQDVDFDVPDPEDIVEPIVAEIPTVADIATAVADELADLSEEIAEEIDIDIPDIDFPEVEVFAQEFIEALTDLEGFFGPVEGDFQRALQDVLGDPDLALEGLDLDFSPLQEAIEGLQADIEEFEVPDLGDIQDAAEDAVRAVLDDVPGGDILLDPDGFIDRQIDRVTDGLVSEEARTNLRESVEDL